MNDFMRGYVEGMLFAETDGEEPLDKNYSIGDLSEELMNRVFEDCHAFLAAAADLRITFQYEYRAGVDFWLTRQHHGDGFWSYPNVYGDKVAQQLTDLAHKFKELDVYVGDNGRIYA